MMGLLLERDSGNVVALTAASKEPLLSDLKGTGVV